MNSSKKYYLTGVTAFFYLILGGLLVGSCTDPSDTVAGESDPSPREADWDFENDYHLYLSLRDAVLYHAFEQEPQKGLSAAEGALVYLLSGHDFNSSYPLVASSFSSVEAFQRYKQLITEEDLLFSISNINLFPFGYEQAPTKAVASIISEKVANDEHLYNFHRAFNKDVKIEEVDSTVISPLDSIFYVHSFVAVGGDFGSCSILNTGDRIIVTTKEKDYWMDLIESQVETFAQADATIQVDSIEHIFIDHKTRLTRIFFINGRNMPTLSSLKYWSEQFPFLTPINQSYLVNRKYACQETLPGKRESDVRVKLIISQKELKSSTRCKLCNQRELNPCSSDS